MDRIELNNSFENNDFFSISISTSTEMSRKEYNALGEHTGGNTQGGSTPSCTKPEILN